MGFINVAEKSIKAKLVYYGVGVGGKTTSLQGVHAIMCPRNEVQLVSINTEEDSTLLFDFLPINLGQVENFKICIQGFTVPGQPKYRQMRKYVLSGADAVVFVVDSQRSRLDENIASFESLLDNLRLNGLGTKLPIILQYNKRDLDDVMTEAELDAHFCFREGIVSFPSVATDRQGVFETFTHAAGMLVAEKVRQYNLGRGEVDPDEVGDSTRRKLWDLFDQGRRDDECVTPNEQSISVRDDASLVEEGDAQEASAAAAEAATLDGPVLSNSELDVALASVDGVSEVKSEDMSNAKAVLERVFGERDDQEGLLDMSVQSSLELARRYGELDQYKNLLQAKNRELVESAQNTVHDLNRPISALKVMLSSVQKGYFGAVEGKVGQAIDTGMLAVKQMERLVGDLLDSSRLDHDGVALDFQDVDMNLLVGTLVETLRYEIEAKSVHIRVEPLPVMRCDEWAMTKVFTNLIGNAVQYIDTDKDQSTVHIGVNSLEDSWELYVEDNGIGIPEQDAHRMFRRFERGSNTSAVSGTGLGLHIIKEIVTGHGGVALVESEEGVGTTFRLRIPYEPVLAEHSEVSELPELQV